MSRMAEIYRLLIADDEYWIREQLRILLDWKSYGIEFLEPACDGEDALIKLREGKPDIFITDINMPFLNGVDLLNETRVAYPKMVPVILSGYSDFQYVKGGLLAGAIDYILKPIEKMELIRVLTKALEKINEDRLLERKRSFEREELLRAAAALNDREFSELITKEQFRSKLEYGGRQHYLPAEEIGGEGYYFLLIKIHHINSIADVFHYDMNLLSYTIKQQIKEKTGEDLLIIFNNVYASSEFVTGLKDRSVSIAEQAYALLLSLKEFTNHFVTIGVSEKHFSEAEFGQAYEEAKRAVLAREFSRTGKVLFYQDVRQFSPKEKRIGREEEKHLLHLIKADPGHVKTYLYEELQLKSCMEQQWTVYEVKQTVSKIIQILTTYSLEMNEKQLPLDLENAEDCVLHAIEDNSLEEVLDLLNELIDTALNIGQELVAAGSGKETVRAVKKYVANHYYEDISLTFLADLFHIDPSYLSKLFKKEQGENLISYISGRRIEKAKEYIANEKERSLTEIAFLVGYDDYNYFNKVFKKLEQLSPREYRIKFTSKN